MEDPAWLEGPALNQVVVQPQLAAEVDRKCPVDILSVAVWRWVGGLGGELAVICDLRSIASF